jgi:hypothetical protein
VTHRDSGGLRCVGGAAAGAAGNPWAKPSRCPRTDRSGNPADSPEDLDVLEANQIRDLLLPQTRHYWLVVFGGSLMIDLPKCLPTGKLVGAPFYNAA